MPRYAISGYRTITQEIETTVLAVSFEDAVQYVQAQDRVDTFVGEPYYERQCLHIHDITGTRQTTIEREIDLPGRQVIGLSVKATS